MLESNIPAQSAWHSAHGKVILFGEHAVVYGIEAVAAAIPDMVRARVTALVPKLDEKVLSRVKIPNWGVDLQLESESTELLPQMIGVICSELRQQSEAFVIEIDAEVPPASGLGASAAVAVAMTKALADFYQLELKSERVNDIAFKCEQLAHGTPSGLDNTLATFGGVLRFRREAEQFYVSPVLLAQPIELLVALSGKKGFTAETVARVRDAKAAQPEYYETVFSEIAKLSQEGISALSAADLDALADLMTRNQVCLRKLGVSCREIEQVLTIAMESGSNGGKLTGSGDGGAVLLSPADAIDDIEQALNHAGFATRRIRLQ